MNSINDIISQKANDLFPSEITPPPNPPSDSIKEPLDKIDVSQAKAMVYKIKDQLDSLLRVLNAENIPEKIANPNSKIETSVGNEMIVEGVFNGEKMVGSDGKEYSVPPNYASKSKLVEGDIMKLTITPKGSFVFKQIGPVERNRLVGELVFDQEKEQWLVIAEGKTYKILTASVTFFKGKTGDETIILTPVGSPSAWAAVENIISK